MRVGFVDSFIFETSSFSGFTFLESFLYDIVQFRILCTSIANAKVRETPRAIAESIKVSLDSEIGTGTPPFSCVAV